MFVPMVAATASGYILPQLALDYGMGASASLAAGVCLLSAFLTTILCVLNDRADAFDKELLSRKNEILSEWYAQDGIDHPNLSTDDDGGEIEASEDDFVDMSLSNIKQLGHLFWCVTFDNLLTFSMLYVQSAIGTAMMEERFGYSEAEAGAIIVTPYMVGAVCMPFVGILADYFGRR